MNDFIRVDVDDAVAQQGLKTIAGKLKDATPAMRNIAEVLRHETERNFAEQGRPRWTPMKNPSERRQGGMLLQDTGRLAASITTGFDSTRAIIGSNVVYAAIHQLGGKTKPHTIRAKNKKALAFGGRVVKSVQHPGSKIPARPYLPVTAAGELQPEAKTGVLDAVMQHLRR